MGFGNLGFLRQVWFGWAGPCSEGARGSKRVWESGVGEVWGALVGLDLVLKIGFENLGCGRDWSAFGGASGVHIGFGKLNLRIGLEHRKEGVSSRDLSLGILRASNQTAFFQKGVLKAHMCGKSRFNWVQKKKGFKSSLGIQQTTPKVLHH